MNKEDEWKNIRDEIDSKDAEIIEKYGFNIRKKFMDITNKENILKKKKRNFVIKVICVLLIILFILYLVHYFSSYGNQVKILKDLDLYSRNSIEFVFSDTNFWGAWFL